MAQRDINTVLNTVTTDYLATINPQNPPDYSVIRSELLDKEGAEIEIENAVRPKGQKLPIPKELTLAQVAMIMLRLFIFVVIRCVGIASGQTDDSSLLLCMYQPDGPNQGTYINNVSLFRHLARCIHGGVLRAKDVDEILDMIMGNVPIRPRCQDRDLIAVNNGIFNFRTKTLMPFSPDYVFLAKSKINYNPNAINQIIYNPDDKTDWDVESWIASLSDDPEIVNLLWEILGAIIRPNVRWNKAAMFYSETGNNGKGTLCALMRNLCGEGTYASIPLSDFSKDFMLEPLIHASAIIVDENDVGTYVDKAANLKAVITNDPIQINRKFKVPIAYQFFGFMVQCLNEMPRIKDKSDSFYRRQLFIPFNKCFTGIERKYIKDDYLARPEVLEYVLHKVLHMDYYTLSVPKACKDALEEYKEYNDSVRQFVGEILPQCIWDLLPFKFLYDLYKAWFKKNIPNGSIQSYRKFNDELLIAIKDNPEWFCIDRRSPVRPKTMMSNPEPLIMDYDLIDWMNSTYKGSDPNQICQPTLASSYCGIIRNLKVVPKQSVIIDYPYGDD